MFAQTQLKSFCGAFFKKRTGSRGAEPPKKRRFSFCEAFSFAPLVSKEKAKEWRLILLSNSAQCTHNPTLPVILSGAKRSRTFFVLDPKRRCAPFAPHYVRSSTALRMTQTKKAPREAKRDLQRSSAHCALSHHNINRHSIAFSFDTRGAKEKASQKENAVFRGLCPSWPRHLLKKVDENFPSGLVRTLCADC